MSCAIYMYMKIYLLSCTVVQAISYNSSLISPFRHVTVSNTTVYISGEGGIVALHRENLSEINVNTSYKNNWLLLYGNGGLVQCNANNASVSHCRKLTSEVSGVTQSSINMIVDIQNFPVYTTAYIPQINKDLFIVGSTSLKYRNVAYGIASFDYDDLSLFLIENYEKGPMNIEIGGKYKLVFKSSFFNESFAYFLFHEMDESGEFSSSRLGKICTNYNTDHTKFSNYLHSYEDMKISCTHEGVLFDAVEYGISIQEGFLVTFKNGSSSLICAFNSIHLLESYIASRKRVLTCGVDPPGNEYFEPETTLGSSNHEYCFDNGTSCEKSEEICAEIEGDFCNTKYHHTIVGNTTVEGVPIRFVEKIITALDFNELNPSNLFVGTDDGQIGKIPLMINESDGRPIQFYSVDTSRVIRIGAWGDDLHVLTQNKYEIINFGDCDQNTSCQLCLLNPKCGWDYQSGRCDSFETNSSWLVTSKEDFCMEVTGIRSKFMNGDKLTAHFSKDNSNINMPQKIRDLLGDPASCGLDKEKPERKDTSICELNFDNFNTGNYTFWIEYNTPYIRIEQTIQFFNCLNFTTCTECVNTGICKFLNFACGRSGANTEDKCPKMIDISPSRIPVNYSYINTTINIVPSSKGGPENFQCEMKMGERIFTSTVSIENPENQTKIFSTITCIGLPTNETGEFEIRIQHMKGFYAFSGVGILEVYSCKTLEQGQECGTCVNLKDDDYNCTWCNAGSNCYNPDTETCSQPAICNTTLKEVYPSSGPIKGGTLLTITGTNLGTADYNVSVDINETQCTIYDIIDYKKLYCVTGEVNSRITNAAITLTVYNVSFPFPEGPYFTYKELQNIEGFKFQPRNGTLSGGKTITISGPNIGFTGVNRYALSFCNNTGCIDCSTLENFTTVNQTKCKTGNSTTAQNMTYLSIQIDTNTKINITQPFYYLPDPTIILPNETKAQEGGGSTFNIKGEGFYNVGEITVDRVEEKCEVPDDNTAVCKTPEFEGGSSNQTVNVNFDGITTQITIYYVPNPRFEKFGGILDYEDPEAAITIRGHGILNGAKKEDYKVDIGMDGKCLINTITMTAINCYPPKNVPRTNNTDPDVVYVIVEGGNLRTYIGDIRYGEKKNYLVIVVGVLAAALVVTVVSGVATVLILKKKKRKAIKAFKMELLSREDMIRKASREEFAEAQMTIRDIKSDLVMTKVPYCDYQQYVFHILFPNQDIKTHPLLLASRVTDDSKIKMQKAMEMLDKLLTNKKFLESLVQTLDRLNKLTMQEKAHFASLLSIALTGNMRLFFNLVNSLLIETIHSGSKRQNKVLFRRFESISQRLMAHWLQIVLYTQLKTQSGLQLFMLYRAVQTVIEKAPVDALTSNSRNTLAEEKLLKMRVEFDSLTLQIDLNGNSDQHYPVKVLDCDTISQVKKKCVEQIYKNRPASDIPHNDELSLEWRIGKGGKHILEDEDTISDRNNGLVRLNTLKHYMVKDNSQMALMYKEHIVEDVYENQSHQLESVTSDDINLVVPGEGDEQAVNTLKWHLESCASNLPDDEKSNREHDIGDIFLNRLFHTKLLLSDYIEIAFEGLMDPQSLSVPIRYFLCMLDKLGKENDIEPDVIQIWKSECYATRLWGPLIGKPQIIFDVDVPAHVEPCMDILKQVFVECFTQTAHKVNKESPPQKLLFHKDIPQYRKRIEPFFIRVEPVDDQTFWGALDEISSSQKNEMKFSRQATLQQLYNLFIAKYSTEIIDDFLDMEESKDLGFGNKLEEVIELMEESATD